MSSCKKDEIMTFDSSKPTIDFHKAYYLSGSYTDYVDVMDTLSMRAIYYSGQSTIEFKLPVRMSGSIIDEDRVYNVALATDKCYGDLVEGVHYTLSADQILSAGNYADSAVIELNVAQITTDAVSGVLVIEHVAGDVFDNGIDHYQSIGVRVSGEGFTTQPAFWNYNNLNDYGGTFSSIKAAKYVELNGVTDDEWKESSSAKLYAYGKRTYEWFRDNPTYDEGVLVEFLGTVKYE